MKASGRFMTFIRRVLSITVAAVILISCPGTAGSMQVLASQSSAETGANAGTYESQSDAGDMTLFDALAAATTYNNDYSNTFASVDMDSADVKDCGDYLEFPDQTLSIPKFYSSEEEAQNALPSVSGGISVSEFNDSGRWVIDLVPDGIQLQQVYSGSIYVRKDATVHYQNMVDGSPKTFETTAEEFHGQAERLAGTSLCYISDYDGDLLVTDLESMQFNMAFPVADSSSGSDMNSNSDDDLGPGVNAETVAGPDGAAYFPVTAEYHLEHDWTESFSYDGDSRTFTVTCDDNGDDYFLSSLSTGFIRPDTISNTSLRQIAEASRFYYSYLYEEPLFAAWNAVTGGEIQHLILDDQKEDSEWKNEYTFHVNDSGRLTRADWQYQYTWSSDTYSGDGTINYSYDSNGRLTSINFSKGNTDEGCLYKDLVFRNYTFDYDSNGNLSAYTSEIALSDHHPGIRSVVVQVRTDENTHVTECSLESEDDDSSVKGNSWQYTYDSGMVSSVSSQFQKNYGCYGAAQTITYDDAKATVIEITQDDNAVLHAGADDDSPAYVKYSYRDSKAENQTDTNSEGKNKTSSKTGNTSDATDSQDQSQSDHPSLPQYTADLYLSEDPDNLGVIQDLQHPEKWPSSDIYKSLKNDDMDLRVTEWKAVHFQPSDQMKNNVLGEQGYYEAILAALFIDNDRLDDSIITSIDNDESSRKAYAEFQKNVLKVFSTGKDITEFTAGDKNKLYQAMQNFYKDSGMDHSGDIEYFGKTAEDVITRSRYRVDAWKAGQQTKAVLDEMAKHADNFEEKLAIQELSNAMNSFGDGVAEALEDSEVDVTKDTIGWLADQGWNAVIEGTPLLNQAWLLVGITDTLTNWFYATDDLTETYVKLECLNNVTDDLLAASESLGNTYLNAKKANKSQDVLDEYASAYNVSIDALLCAKMVGCDYAKELGKNVFSKALAGDLSRMVSKGTDYTYTNYAASLCNIKEITAGSRFGLNSMPYNRMRDQYPDWYSVLKGDQVIRDMQKKYLEQYDEIQTDYMDGVVQGTSITGLESRSQGFKVSWDKVSSWWLSDTSKKITGYEVQLSTEKDFSEHHKTYRIANKKTTGAEIQSLEPNTTYYVRIRTYRQMDWIFYSGWSEAKKVVTGK